MKYYILTLIVQLLFLSCQSEYETEPADVNITAVSPEGMEIDKLQANLILTNVNTKNVIQTSDFNNSSINVECLYGLYNITIEGLASVKTDKGTSSTRQIRGYMESVKILDKAENVRVQLVLMN